jgi:hypothetical protein
MDANQTPMSELDRERAARDMALRDAGDYDLDDEVR